MFRAIVSIFIVIVFLTLNLSPFHHINAQEKTVQRISGDSRILTAINISKQGWPSGLTHNQKVVILARADVPADALASSSLTGVYDAPILLTPSDRITQPVLDEIRRLGAQRIFLLGGQNAIHNSVFDTLTRSGYNVTRIDGETRFATAANINVTAGTSTNTRAFVVNGVSIADALSASSISAIHQIPIYLASNNSLPVELPNTVQQVTIFGGTAAVSQAVENQIKAKGIQVTRISGNNRYETNLAAIRSFDFASDRTIVVRGTSVSSTQEDYPDAVAAAGLAQKNRAPIVLTHPTNVQQSVKQFLDTKQGTFYFLGGPAAISDQVMNNLTNTNSVITEAQARTTVNIRNSASTNGSVIGSYTAGTRIQIYDFQGDWAKVKVNSTTWGYVHSFFLNITGSNNLLRGHTIVVDAGHGGKDPGAVGNGLIEKELVLDISLRLENKLKAAGANVIMTRKTDVFIPLEERAKIANDANGHAFVSVHANSGPGTAHGSETYWNRNNTDSAESRELAEKIQKRMAAHINTNDRGVKEANFSVTRNALMPAVLVEVGFLSNVEEAQRMKTAAFREGSAEAVYQGVLDFYR